MSAAEQIIDEYKSATGIDNVPDTVVALAEAIVKVIAETAVVEGTTATQPNPASPLIDGKIIFPG